MKSLRYKLKSVYLVKTLKHVFRYKTELSITQIIFLIILTILHFENRNLLDVNLNQFYFKSLTILRVKILGI